MKVHYTHEYLLNPPHQVSVDLIGLGGTGSQMLSGLGRLNMALRGLGHPGLHVRCWDNDTVTEANLGRQLFSSSDLGMNKAVVLATRINRFFGTEWQAMPQVFGSLSSSNITISCIDSAVGRVMLDLHLNEGITGHRRGQDPTKEKMYWLDMGNLQKSGQVVLGTLRAVKQPKGQKNTTPTLPTVIKKFPQIRKIKDEDQGPSCSLAEALRKQDLFINSTLAQFGCAMLWKVFREGMIKYHGCYLNLDTFTVNPIKVS